MLINGSGSEELKKIRRKKEKHTWCIQIMNAFLDHSSMYEYDDNGRQPLWSSFPSDSDTIGMDHSTFEKIKPSTIRQNDGGKRLPKCLDLYI